MLQGEWRVGQMLGAGAAIDEAFNSSGDLIGILLGSASLDSTGKPVAGPFDTANWAGAIRLSPDSKKLAGDIQTQKLNQRVEGKKKNHTEKASTHIQVHVTLLKSTVNFVQYHMPLVDSATN